MNKYDNGKIYKLVNNVDDQIYEQMQNEIMAEIDKYLIPELAHIVDDYYDDQWIVKYKEVIQALKELNKRRHFYDTNNNFLASNNRFTILTRIYFTDVAKIRKALLVPREFCFECYRQATRHGLCYIHRAENTGSCKEVIMESGIYRLYRKSNAVLDT